MNTSQANPIFNPTVGDMQVTPLVLAPWFSVERPITFRVWETMTHAEWAAYVDSQRSIRWGMVTDTEWVKAVDTSDKTAEILSMITGMN